MLELEDRQRENDKYSKWQEDEDKFHLKQAHLRSNIRIVDGRAKPIDLLAKYISAEEGKFCKYFSASLDTINYIYLFFIHLSFYSH